VLPKTPENRAAAFGAGLLLILAAVVLGAFFVSRSDWFIAARRGFLSKKPVTGRVVDHASGKPIAGASVDAVSTGYDLARFGALTSFHAKGTSATDGHFELALRILGRPELTATKAGYVKSRVSLKGTRAVTVPIMPVTAQHNDVREAFATFIYHSEGDSFDLDVVKREIVKDGHVRIWLRKHSGAIHVAAGRGAGIRYVSGEGIPGVDNVLANECVAPDSGYGTQIDVPATDSLGIFFIKTEDRRYGSVILAPRSFPAFYDSIRGAPFTLTVHFNAVGGRGLCGSEHLIWRY